MGYMLTSLHVISFVLQLVHCDRDKVFKVNNAHVTNIHSLREDFDSLNQVRAGKDLKKSDIVSYLKNIGARDEHFSKPSTEYMMKVFENLLQGERLAVATGHTDRRTRPQIRRADTIRSFTAQGENQVYNIHIPALPNHEINGLAELRFHGNQKLLKRRPKFELNIYNDVTQEYQTFNLSPKPKIEDNSHIFDISKALISTLNRNHGNISLEIRTKLIWASQEVNKYEIQTVKPILVLYSQDKQFMKSVFNDLVTKDMDKVSKRHKRATNEKKGRRRKNRYRKRKSDSEICQLYDFKVDFDLIGWGPWIIHPKTFNSKVCYGQCPEPIASEYRPTNHAMLQTLMRMKRPLSAPATCCVPTKLRPLSMLYFEYDDIVVRHHEDMVAAECGCR